MSGDEFFPCTCAQQDPNDPPCGSEECGGEEAQQEFFDDEAQRIEEEGGDPLTAGEAYGYGYGAWA